MNNRVLLVVGILITLITFSISIPVDDCHTVLQQTLALLAGN